MTKPRPATDFSREFKLAAVQRMIRGENVVALARELKTTRKNLYQWRDRFRAGGANALRCRGRPSLAAIASQPESMARQSEAWAQAQQRIADLERKVGRQQVELDFFQRALRHIKGVRQQNGGHGAPASTRSSKR